MPPYFPFKEDHAQTLLDLSEPPGVVLDAIAVGPQRRAQLLELQSCGLGHLGERHHRRIEVPKLGEALRCRPNQVSGGRGVLSATGDRGVRVPGELDDLLGVGVDSLGVAELVLLASLQACPADLLDLVPEQVRSPGKLAFVTPQVGQLPIQASQACP